MKRKNRLALVPPPEVLARKRKFLITAVPQFLVYADTPEEALKAASEIQIEHAMFALVGSDLALAPKRRVKLAFSVSRIQEMLSPEEAHAVGNGHADEQTREEPAPEEEA